MKHKSTDKVRVWLTLRSETIKTGDEIGDSIGMTANAPPLKSSEGRFPRKSFSLQSDLDVDEKSPLEAHFSWLAKICDGKLDKISSFLSQQGNSGEIFIYVVTQDDASYAYLQSNTLAPFVLAGLDVNVKIECDQ